MHFGLIEQHIKILWVCLLIKWFMEKHVIYLLSKNLKLIGKLTNSTMISNMPVRRGYLILAHLMNGEPKPMKMPSCLKKNLKDGMTNESKSVSLKLENMFFCTTLVLDFLQVSSSLNGKAHTSSRRFTGLEPSK